MLHDVVFKLLKWTIAMSFLILGIYTLRLASFNYDIKPIGITILSFGFVVWLSKTTFDASKKVFITGLGCVIAAWLINHFIGYVFVEYYLGLGYFMSWEVITLAIGIPVMAVVFAKE